MDTATVRDAEVGAWGDRLLDAGFVHLEGPSASAAAAHTQAEAIVRCAENRSADRGMPDLALVGEFLIPPEGTPSRDFQVLHFDFGLPVDPRDRQDVARYTALHVPVSRPAPTASTRLIHLEALLGQRDWAPRAELAERMVEYGANRGRKAARASYIEGVLARLVEAADDAAPSLPASSQPGFLCGQEFGSAAEEGEFFASRGLRSDHAQISVRLRPGQLLVLDNLVLAHGRSGVREPQELHQWMFGYRKLDVDRQLALRDRLLDAFGGPGLSG